MMTLGEHQLGEHAHARMVRRFGSRLRFDLITATLQSRIEKKAFDRILKLGKTSVR